MTELTLGALKHARRLLESAPPPIELIVIHPDDFSQLVKLMTTEGYLLVPGAVEWDGLDDDGTPINWRMEDDGRRYLLVIGNEGWLQETPVYLMDICKPGEWLIVNRNAVQDMARRPLKVEIDTPDYSYFEHLRWRLGL